MHPFHQLTQVEGFGQYLGTDKFCIPATQGDGGKAGNKHDLEFRMGRPGTGRQLKTVERRHHHIGHQQVKLHGF